MTNRIATTFNEYGTPVTMFWCDECQTTFTVCPEQKPENDWQWAGCLGTTCPSYDEARDADKLFDEGKVFAVGDRSHIQVVPEGDPA